MRLTENRKLAFAVLAVCVLLSVFVLGGAALGRERGKVLKLFNDGAYAGATTRQSMDAYLDDVGEQASVMANEAALHLGESDLTRAILANAATVANDSAGLDARSQAYTELRDQVEKLYNSMYSGVDEKGRVNFMKAYKDFWGDKDMIDRDEYHKQARSYNDLISGFPGGLVATLTRQGSLNTFGG